MNVMLTLDKYELAELTGTRRTKVQIEWLRSNGIPFLVGVDDKPKVLRTTITAMLSRAISSSSLRAPKLNLGIN